MTHRPEWAANPAGGAVGLQDVGVGRGGGVGGRGVAAGVGVDASMGWDGMGYRHRLMTIG